MSELVEFHMPDVGEGIAEAEVLQWLVEVGEVIAADQPMVQIETDKSIVEIPSPVTGTLLKQGVAAGELAKVNELLAVIGDGTGVLGQTALAPARSEVEAGGPVDVVTPDSEVGD